MVTVQNEYIWAWLKRMYPYGGVFLLHRNGHFTEYSDTLSKCSFEFVAILKITPNKNFI